MTAYLELEARFRRLAVLGEVAAVLHWDSAAMMPAGGAESRSEQLATLAVMRHELLADPALADLLDAAEAAAAADAAALQPWQQANLREMRRRWRHATALDAGLVAALSQAAAACEQRWRTARADDDFAAVQPLLEQVMALVRDKAAAKADAFACTAYDALLDEYEPGLTAARIDALFAPLQQELPALLDQVLARQQTAPAPLPLPGPFPAAHQQALAERLMARVGFDFRHGRLDTSHHPFTGGVPDDVRLTTRYDEDDVASGLMAVLHETGHAMYERGLPPAWRLQPVGEAMGMGIHESQSLIVEMQAGRSAWFVGFLAGELRAMFHADGPAWQADNLRRLLCRVDRSLIRVDADEVSYPLHIVLRFQLERRLLAGELAVAELPAAWRDGMQALLGVVPVDDRDGCLQDIHWMGGDLGYFPTYTLGAIAAAQLFAAARAAEPGLPEALAAGDFSPLLGWLARTVHAQAAFHPTADDLLTEVTGRPLDVAGFLAHLRARYLADEA